LQHNSCYPVIRVASEKAIEAEVYFRFRSYYSVAQNTRLENRPGNSLIYVMTVSANASVPHQEMEDHIKNRGAKGSNVSKCIRNCSYNSYLDIVAVKHAEQIPTKQKENTVSLGGEHQKVETETGNYAKNYLYHKHQAVKRCGNLCYW
jgi:hypothetical protein